MNQEFRFKTAQNSKNLRFNGHTSFESQNRNYITCFGHICNHPQGWENHIQKYINIEALQSKTMGNFIIKAVFSISALKEKKIDRLIHKSRDIF